MKVLVVGGTGMIGAHVATLLRERGDDVTVAARGPVPHTSPVADFPLITADYTVPTLTADDLSGFEGIAFAAGQDIRHKTRTDDDEEFWRTTQSEGVPRFAALAKAAGVTRFVQVGSYYHQYDPALADANPYVAARRDADERTRALADSSFAACTLNPPSILGVVPGASAERYRRFVAWAAGDQPDIPDFAPPGGTNYMSARSLAQAVAGALHRGEPGAAYLVGDENLTYREFFQRMVDAAGGGRTIVERDEPHPLLPDAAILQGRGNTIAYETDAETMRVLDYRRGDCTRAIGQLVTTVRDYERTAGR
ncbi:NAD(P)-dependent oxidoreductase [Dietzia sp. ANT_WB102]|uniref:NAD-dependent epimerase/dehydratase family protein n=1 Tax=Dietzia sp. ANT_WB102 TaxID=2597345 RepID=UPI0011EE5124|nr:NAD-dependent epimerase/dehydratase family protein [Dietzia sp. ANT_WB102]KAA0918935.1 NAD-dependent epimerase/dehydratase family protein [Dietzia sp. ANT_WB102]